MTTYPKSVLAAIVMLGAGLPAAWAGEPNDSTLSLKFELRQTSLGPFDASRVDESGGPYDRAFAARKPAYAAAIPSEGPTGYLFGPGRDVMIDFLHAVLGEAPGMVGTGAYGELSAAQKEFLRTTHGRLDFDLKSGPAPQWYRSQDYPNTRDQLLLYAMTLDDAKAMAQAYTEFAVTRWRSDVDERRKRVEEFERGIAGNEAQIGELTKLVESSEQTLNALKPKIPYRTEKEAAAAIAELDRALNVAQVDIAGIQSKIKAIQEHLRTRKSPYSEAIRDKLEGMFVEESVALVGAEARKAMAIQLRGDASRLLDLKEEIAEANKKRADMGIGIIKLKPELQRERKNLESVMAEKPRIADHLIAVYPVAWTNESEGDSMPLGRP